MALPNISKATTRITKQITICGELQVIEKLILLCISNLQSSQVKRTPQNSINEFNIRKLSPLAVVDFRFISTFLHEP